MVTTTASTVRPVDFHHSTRQGPGWTAGMLRHLIAAIGDTPVIMCTEAGSGHTLVGVTLRGFGSTASVHHGIVYRSTFSDGTTQDTVVAIRSIAESIVVLDEPGTRTKWEALQSYGEEASLAIDAAKAAWGEEGVVSWIATPSERDVYVKAYAESPYLTRYARTVREGSVTLAMVEEARVARAARAEAHMARWQAEQATR